MKRWQNLEAAETLYLYRFAGLGDVLMALPVVAALVRCFPGKEVVFLTRSTYREIIVNSYQVPRALYLVRPQTFRPEKNSLLIDLNPARLGTSPRHQIEAYLGECGLRPEEYDKEIRIAVPSRIRLEVQEILGRMKLVPGRERVVVHAAKGDPNRTWPRESYLRLLELIKQDGCEIILIGKDDEKLHRGVHELSDSGTAIHNLVNQLSLLQTVALLDECDVLITTDSGPVQLAAATGIGIAAIYTVIAGEYRLPFRHSRPGWNCVAIRPECRHYSCYEMMTPAQIALFRRRFQLDGVSNASLFPFWCLEEEMYRCLKMEITPEKVWSVARRLLESKR